MPTTNFRPANISERQVWQWIIVLLIMLQFSALFVPLLEPDAALYAVISKNMALRHDYLNLFLEGHDWLDKPHFPFWVTALSFQIFGIHTWSYKLPAILFLLMGAWYTYRFARDIYGEDIARWSVCILLTAEHLVLSNNDVRAEPYLTGLIIAAVYHFHRRQVLPGAIFAACAIMTKGIFAIVPIGAAIGGQMLFTRNWKELLHWRWLVAIVLTFLFITPELYALYQQFDAHPEKLVFGRHAVSGLRFFFWDSQFGRFMNTGPIKGSGDPFFFFHTVLWAFLPWSVMLYAAVIQFFRRFKTEKDFQCICGALATFLLFSLSRFQLPHYLNIVFPFFAILTAKYILSLETEKGLKFFRVTQYTIIILVAILGIVIDLLYKPAMHFLWLIPAGALILLYILLHYWMGKTTRQAVFYRSVAISILLNLYLNTVLYPDMMQYQSGTTVAAVANKQFAGQPVRMYKAHSYSLEFYANAPVSVCDSLCGPGLYYTNAEGLATISRYHTIQKFPQFWVSKLDLPFVRKATRAGVLEERFLVEAY
ncbi:4-amino-4-deoxy-L-arabinose transferase-like glycosyltransferase [Chitinophaga dinghuensis]|uniref:4-amino-4-deoxy-L-arabinose transferase-like glycosyltransferase n=1 Tax=Chitinophaga dinghuensis TaxID=1539050 RepID=A0A327W4I7_9BACT|nr:glycosyltransferase family 39 protein [Chitinophaga dinghuensis]RAJ85315.1 4-amino-4-deoxy-L-arabinose transferase-like glycosyltransferase [Chitinophaga dinghuensis]